MTNGRVRNRQPTGARAGNRRRSARFSDPRMPSAVPARRPTGLTPARGIPARSEEHTSELQSLMRISYAVFCLKKKNKTHSKKTEDSLQIHMQRAAYINIITT